ncbi:MAG: 4-hydroxy-tetrahydrodipicolinate synthase [Firmicutes bacterium]|nr:4-hydroxy-tetrahydrodipicolinate synthase [candidate division NPL-UPA2 bacterium]
MHFGRLITAMATPFDQAGYVDESGVRKLAEHLIATGTETVVVSGTTGESPTLSASERVLLIELVKEVSRGRARVIAGVGTNSTSDTLQGAHAAVGAGADGVMVVTPYYNKPPQESLYHHFMAVARAVDVPILIYNVPGRTGCNLLPATVVRLSQCSSFLGIKEASGSLDQISEIIRAVREDFVVYSGDDSLTLPMLAVGADGVVSVASHIIGQEIAEMTNAYFAGDYRRAKTVHAKVFPLFKALFCTTSPIPLKWALNRLGLPGGTLRPPLYSISQAEAEVVEQALQAVGRA